MNRIVSAWRSLRQTIRDHDVEIRLSLRVTVAALVTYGAAQYLHLPLALWAVLTSIILSQLSVGRSLKVTIDYFAGTLGGAVYSSAVATLIPHASEAGVLAVLAIGVAPLALLAAIYPRFAAAPFTGVLVLLVPMLTHVGPLESAYYRVIEVALGGFVAVVVSFIVFPSRAQRLAIDDAARLLDLLARALRALLAGLTQPLDQNSLHNIQDHIGEAIARLNLVAEEAKRERMTPLATDADLGPLLRTVLRLRHDLVMIGRAASMPLPLPLQPRLGPPLARVTAAASDYLSQSAAALLARRAPPPAAPVDAALEAYVAELEAVRREGLTRILPAEAVEHLFTLGFGLEQLHRNFRDLDRIVAGFARAPQRVSEPA
jgi:uncharacterized membrane protein YccC